MSGWYGVDFDGTLAEYHGWNGGELGKPIPTMVTRVLDWCNSGKEVRIMTARASVPEEMEKIQIWCKLHLGRVLAITDRKDFGMIELWDDRAVRVVPNTGLTCCEFEKLKRK